MRIRLLVCAAMLLSASVPSFAADADVHVRHHHHHARGTDEIYLHNYGPPDFYPGTNIPPDRVVYPVNGAPYGIYDGFGRHCEQSTANYRGQDGRRHSCN
ncbi:MAG: hypothetical protein KGQ48_09385 [Bradyrhizobium sp.]|nr:hypothetical protein [Bradyrhizobium sp.]